MSRFLQLFARGRYVTTRSIAQREAAASDTKVRHAERERFAVAAVAFCLEHDKKFLAHFGRVVGIPTRAKVREINVEPKQWGDLVLRTSREVLIIEFKLGALLVKHQDPRKLLFTQDGYGAKIRAQYPNQTVRYLVIGEPIARGRTRDGLEFAGISWSKMIGSKRAETPLEGDLYDCVGTLGAPILSARRMTKRSLKSEVISAMEVYRLLQQAAAAAGDIPTGDSDSGIDHVGVNIPAGGARPDSRHAQLRKIVIPKGRFLGWIGYEELDELSVSVWFYASATTCKPIRAKLAESSLGEVEQDRSSVGIRRRARNSFDHVRWIADVLLAVAA